MNSQITDLKSQQKFIKESSDQELLESLIYFREKSHPEIVLNFIDRWHNSGDLEVKKRLYNFLIDLKDNHCLPYIFQAINNQQYVLSRVDIIAILWQSALDASEYLNELIELALQGDYLIIFEVSTVIESFDQTFSEDDVVELAYTIQEAIDNETESNRHLVLNDLKGVLNNLPVH